MDFAIQETRNEWRLRKGAKGTGQRVGTWPKNGDLSEVLHEIQDLAQTLTPHFDIAYIQNDFLLQDEGLHGPERRNYGNHGPTK